jgi:hypothetical protein
MCEHAVAIILAARAVVEGGGAASNHAPAALPKATVLESRTPALAVHFFSHWTEEWSKNRCTVRIETSEREADDSDELLMKWARRQGIDKKPLPWILTLGPDTIDEFLDGLTGHSEILSGKQTIACNAGQPRVMVCTELVRETWVFTLDDEAGRYLGGKKGVWWHKCNQLFQTTDSFLGDFLFTLFSEKSTSVTVAEYFRNPKISDIVTSSNPRDPIYAWKSQRVDPHWNIQIEGSMRQLRLRVEKEYACGEQMLHRPWNESGCYLLTQANVCFYSKDEDEKPCETLLKKQGWAWDSEKLIWLLADEESILRFVCEGREELRSFGQTFIESPQLTTILERVVTIEPRLEVREENSQELSLSMEFRSSSGKTFDSAKIRQLLQSGKRLIQTSDGISLLLPRDSWEVFQRTATDLHLEQKKGEFLAKKSQSLLIDYLRKYIDKSLNVNLLTNIQSSNYPALKAQLRDYQSGGAHWLCERLGSHGFALLADEMGLGNQCLLPRPRN